MLGNDLPTALRWGSINSAAAIEQVGSQPGLLRRHELLERAASMQAPEMALAR
jgi:hypothetical protein